MAFEPAPYHSVDFGGAGRQRAHGLAEMVGKIVVDGIVNADAIWIDEGAVDPTCLACAVVQPPKHCLGYPGKFRRSLIARRVCGHDDIVTCLHRILLGVPSHFVFVAIDLTFRELLIADHARRSADLSIAMVFWWDKSAPMASGAKSKCSEEASIMGY